MYNLGICGDTTDGLLVRFASEARLRNPEIIIIAIGINDSAVLDSTATNWVPINRFVSNLAKLSQLSETYARSTLFVGLTTLNQPFVRADQNDDKIYNQAEIIRYDQALVEHCNTNNIPYIPIGKVALCEDGLHPNSAGHNQIYQAIKPVVTKLLQSQ